MAQRVVSLNASESLYLEAPVIYYHFKIRRKFILSVKGDNFQFSNIKLLRSCCFLFVAAELMFCILIENMLIYTLFHVNKKFLHTFFKVVS